MWKLLILLAFVAVEARPPREIFEARSDVPFIVGGSPIGKGRWGWQLSLQVCGIGCGHTCGAVLLSGTKSVTAAHCTSGRSGFQILAGASNLADGDEEASEDIDDDSIAEHPGYGDGRPGIQDDVATMRHANIPASAPNVVYATMVAQGESRVPGSTCFISGWGKLHGEDAGSPAQLHEVQIDAITLEDCQDRMPINLADNIGENQQCVHSDTEDRGSCQGDSGGPLQCQIGGSWQIAGITSWGVGRLGGSTCLTEYPSVYARVAFLRSWIDDN